MTQSKIEAMDLGPCKVTFMGVELDCKTGPGWHTGFANPFWVALGQHPDGSWFAQFRVEEFRCEVLEQTDPVAAFAALAKKVTAVRDALNQLKSREKTP